MFSTGLLWGVWNCSGKSENEELYNVGAGFHTARFWESTAVQYRKRIYEMYPYLYRCIPDALSFRPQGEIFKDAPRFLPAVEMTDVKSERQANQRGAFLRAIGSMIWRLSGVSRFINPSDHS